MEIDYSSRIRSGGGTASKSFYVLIPSFPAQQLKLNGGERVSVSLNGNARNWEIVAEFKTEPAPVT
jgi:hypothetical protein